MEKYLYSTNAGIAFSKPFQKIKSKEFKNIIDINYI